MTTVTKSKGKSAKRNWAKKGLKVQVCVSYRPELLADLRRLHASTRVPMAVYFEEALADLLVKHAAVLKKARND
jgi:Ribbon-helix-helix domain